MFFSQAHYLLTRLEALKPRTARAEFTKILSSTPVGEVRLENLKFSTKIRSDPGQIINVKTSDGKTVFGGRATQTKGKSTIIQTPFIARGVDIVEYEVVGRATGTLSDFEWQTFMREALEDTISVYDSLHTTRILWAENSNQKERRTTKKKNEENDGESQSWRHHQLRRD